MARAFWREMGVRVNTTLLDDWPMEQIDRYQIVMHEVDNWEQAQIAAARAKAEQGRRGG